MAQRKSILIRCSEEEAELIHRAAQAERRTISGYILNAVMGRIQASARMRAMAEPPRTKAGEQPEQK